MSGSLFHLSCQLTQCLQLFGTVQQSTNSWFVTPPLLTADSHAAPRRAGRPESMCTVHNHFIPLTITSLFDDKYEPAALTLRHRLTKTYNRLNNDYKIRVCSLLTVMSNWYENKLIFDTTINFWQFDYTFMTSFVKKKIETKSFCLKNMWLIRKLIHFGNKRTKFEKLCSTKTAEW